jgi:hypothetical protein
MLNIILKNSYMKNIKRIVPLIFILSGLNITVNGQVTDVEKTLRTQSADTIRGWKKGGVLSLNLAQTSLTNWAAGGQNSFSINGLLSAFANYKNNKSVWDNSLDIGYGLLKQGKDSRYTKTDDKFDLLSKYGKEAFKNFYYSALFNFKTQMSPGYKYPDYTNKISDFFAPAYITLALGMDYKPDAYFSMFIAPITEKFTFVIDQTLSEAGAFGVKPGEKTLSEFGGYLRAIYSRNDFKKELLKNVTFTTKIDLFSNYMKNPQNIVVNWETLLALKVNKFLSASINTQLVYDDKIRIPIDKNADGIIEPGESVGSLVQFKEILGIGFSYKF